jgi:hypothetical protein
VALSRQLLARYERVGESDDLYEAFQWISRDWSESSFQRDDIVQVALVRHCGHKVLRWHWLCVSGE